MYLQKLPYLGPPARRSRRKRRNQSVRPWQNVLKMNNVLLSHKEINLDTKTVPYSLEQLSADDPEIIFVVTMGKAEEINKKMDEQMRDNPAWANIQAVKNNRVYFLPSDLFLMNPGVNTPKAMNQLLDLAYHQ